MRDSSHPIDDVVPEAQPAPEGLFLVPEIHAAAKAAGFHAPASVLQFAERTCHHETGTLAKLGDLSQQEQEMVLFALHELAESGGAS
jgi:hypothetical protein